MYKALDKWLWGYLKSLRWRSGKTGAPQHVFLTLCDHYEPLGPADTLGLDYGRPCVARWLQEYPALFTGFRDADGRPPQHTFFYPEDQYVEELVEGVAGLCSQGFGEVEIHLHHRNDTADTLRSKLATFRDLLRKQHGLLGSLKAEEQKRGRAEEQKSCRAAERQNGRAAENNGSLDVGRGSSDLVNEKGRTKNQETSPATASAGRQGTRNDATGHGLDQPVYAFIHGNWAICNSRPDGDWCGVDNEVEVLKETGCYVDMTMPSAPSPTQSRRVNSIYYVPSNSGCRGHDHGTPVHAGDTTNHENGLMFVQGPLGLNFSSRKFGILPRIENADISGGNAPSSERFKLWLQQCIQVKGKPDWTFIKLHTHGCLPRNADLLLSETMRNFHAMLQKQDNLIIHYVTAREMFNVIKAAEAGEKSWRCDLLNFRVASPPRFNS